jgi:hypothetical protein
VLIDGVEVNDLNLTEWEEVSLLVGACPARSPT